LVTRTKSVHGEHYEYFDYDFSIYPGRARKQRGASALEYIVLAAALIIIIGVLATNGTVRTALETAFTDLFTEASDTTPPAG